MAHQQFSVPRGIQTVRAETDAAQVQAAIALMNQSFEEFKAKHKEEVSTLRLEVEDAHVKIAARPMRSDDAELPADPVGVKVLRTPKQFHAHYAARAEGADKDVTLTDFVRGVAGLKTTPAAIKALGVGTDTAGGYTVPSVVMPSILSALVPASSLLQAGAGVVPMDFGAKSVTTAAVSTVPAAQWRLEHGAVAESEPVFRAVVGTPQSLAFYFKISRELLADANNIEVALRTAIAQAFAKELDRAGLRGSGTAPEPRGLLNTTGVNIVNHGSANGATLTDYAPLLTGMGTMLAADAPMPSAAICAPRTLIKWAGLADTTGQPIRKPEIVQNLPILATSQVPINLTAGTSNDCSEIYMGDFTRMNFLMRENVSIQRLGELFAGTGEIGFVCHVRADVLVSYPKAFTVIKGIRA